MKSKKEYDLLLENSLKFDSNLNTLLSSVKDEILDETSSTSDMAGYSALITKLISRVKAKSDLKYFCSVIPTKTPTGKIPSFGKLLVGKESENNNATTNIKIFKVANASTYSEDGDITTATAVGKVLHKESEGNLLLVEVISGTFATGDAIDNANPFVAGDTTISEIYTNLHMVGTLLKDYSGDYATVAGEVIDDYKEVDFKLSLADVVVTSKFINTGYTLEALTDLINMYGVQYKDIFVKNLQSVLADIERAKIFRFMRDNAYVRGDVVLTSAYGTQGGIKEVYQDIYSRINQSIGAIGTNTGIVGDYTVVVSSNVSGALETALSGKIKEVDGIKYLPNGATLVEDSYSNNDYIVVALRGPEDNGAVIFAPYSIEVISAKSPEDFVEKIKLQSRSDIINNPLATFENGQNRNEMMEYSLIDFSALTNQF